MHAVPDDALRIQLPGTAVNDGLKAFKGNIIFASHDHEFISTVANRIMEIDGEGHLTDKLCTYDEYVEMQA